MIFLSQILREIRFGEFGRAFFAVFGPLNFVNLLKYSLQKVQKFIKNQNPEALNVSKLADFETLNSPTLISRKI